MIFNMFNKTIMLHLNTGFAVQVCLHVPKRSQRLSKFNRDSDRDVLLLQIWLSKLILVIKCNYYGYRINNRNYFELRV
jgi:hypothetical protein